MAIISHSSNAWAIVLPLVVNCFLNSALEYCKIFSGLIPTSFKQCKAFKAIMVTPVGIKNPVPCTISYQQPTQLVGIKLLYTDS